MTKPVKQRRRTWWRPARPATAQSPKKKSTRVPSPVAPEAKTEAAAKKTKNPSVVAAARRSNPKLQYMQHKAELALVPQQKQDRLTISKNGPHEYSARSKKDDLRVSQNGDGSVDIKNRSSGKTTSLSAEQAAQGLVIKAGKGDDRIEIDESVTIKLTVDGGQGNDSISARRSRGKLRLLGGKGDDRITGGRGNDRIDGGEGNDRIDGGAGDDRLAGGKGDDVIQGGDGTDQLLGDDGDDTLYGGDGGDVLIGGQGADTVAGGQGTDALYVDADDRAANPGAQRQPSLRPDSDVDMVIAAKGSERPEWMSPQDVFHTYDPAQVDVWLRNNPSFVIKGGSAAQERARADLGVMLQTKTGAGLLDAVSKQLKIRGTTLDIDLKQGPGGEYWSQGKQVTAGQYSEGYSDGANRSPLPVLFHEVVHAYQDLSKTGAEGHTKFEDSKGRIFTVDNTELQATGLPWMNEFGFLQTEDSFPFSDNGFRRELGLPLRKGYGGSNDRPLGHSRTEIDPYARPTAFGPKPKSTPNPWWT